MYWCILSVWVHFGWFHYCMKLGAKRSELEQLMQKFVPRSRIGIFGSERTRSTPLDPKLMIWCVLSVWVHLAMFHYYTKLGAKRAELVQLIQKFVAWTHIVIFGNERTRSTQLDPKVMFWCIS